MRYCRSAQQKWEEVRAAALSRNPADIISAARERASPMVAQALYRPYRGTGTFRRAKVVPMHWFSRSPPKTQSRSSGPRAAFSSAAASTAACMAASACS